eukprot:gene8955-biopygen1245
MRGRGGGRYTMLDAARPHVLQSAPHKWWCGTYSALDVPARRQSTLLALIFPPCPSNFPPEEKSWPSRRRNREKSLADLGTDA